MQAAVTQVKAMHSGPWGPAGTLFTVAIAENERKSSLKMKIAAAGGPPPERQKLMLGALNQARRRHRGCMTLHAAAARRCRSHGRTATTAAAA